MILVDTGPLVALCDRHDSQHERALTDLESLASGGLITCQAVVAEACFHLPRGYQRQRLQAWFDGLSIDVSRDDGDASFTRDVFAWMARYAEHEPDWADGCLAVLSARHWKLKVWTYDREFHSIWRRPDGSAIPLALAQPAPSRRRRRR